MDLHSTIFAHLHSLLQLFFLTAMLFNIFTDTDVKIIDYFTASLTSV